MQQSSRQSSANGAHKRRLLMRKFTSLCVLILKRTYEFAYRNPVPDYYNLTLELSRDRTTRAWSMECTSADKTSGLCPADVAVGSQYTRRSLNAVCPLFVCFHSHFLLG